MKFFYKFSVVIIIIAMAIVSYLHRDYLIESFSFIEKEHYVTSEKCKGCHQTHYSAWKETLHPKMFKAVENPEEILGNFKTKNPIVTFNKKDIEFVIGSKWEQVYARKIDGEYYPFTAKWMVITQKWVAYKVNTWKQTPLSIKCNGCHTTGFNPQNYEFSEFGIGCEACHGPGSKHLQNSLRDNAIQCTICHNKEHNKDLNNTPKDIIVSYKSAVCGQCHSRGSQTIDKDHMAIKFNFPLEYMPGKEITSEFKPLTEKQDKKGKYWWGNGFSKNRHQEYADFSRSKHSNSLKNLKEKRKENCQEPEDSCLKCHSTDYRMADDENKPSLSEAREGITCIACHDPHGIDKKYVKDTVGANKCNQCHANSLSRSTIKTGKPHTPCPSEKVQCADCHMPRIVTTGGTFSLRSHAFQIIPPQATEKYQMPNSCQNGGCHKNKSLQWAKDEFNEYYPSSDKRLKLKN
ncbi:MAG: multiheme c-type cytochrome [Pseudomonadota bacterium]